jgi:proline iminopeptidase
LINIFPQLQTALNNLNKDYDRTGKLKEIKTPSLYICGEFGEATPPTVKYYQSVTPDSKFIMIKNAAHMSMHHNPSQNKEVPK